MVDGQSADHVLKPGSLVVGGGAQSTPSPFGQIPLGSDRRHGAGDRVPAIGQQEQATRLVSSDAQLFHHGLSGDRPRS